MSDKKLMIQSGTEQVELKKEELFCWDCKKELREKDEFVHYIREKVNYFKCKKCHQVDPQLHYQECEVFSRIVGYIRPVQQWNPGKEQEWKDRVPYKVV